MDKTELTILGSAAGVALIAAAGALLWIFVIGGAPAADENPDDPLIEMRLEEMQPPCVEIALAILTPDEISATAGEAADGKPFFHESAMTEEILGMPYSEISAECTRAMVRGMDADGGYYGEILDCAFDLMEGGVGDMPPIERLRQAIACADAAIGIDASADAGGGDAGDAESPDDRPKG